MDYPGWLIHFTLTTTPLIKLPKTLHGKQQEITSCYNGYKKGMVEMIRKSKESVWDYPRPPRVEAYNGLIEVVHKDKHLAKSNQTFRVLETSHPPGFYIPQDDCNMSFL